MTAASGADEPASGPGAPDGGPHRWHVPWAGGRAVLDAVAIFIGAQVVAVLFAQLVVASTGATDAPPVAVFVAVTPVAMLTVAVGWLAARYGSAARSVVGLVRWSDVGVGVGVGVACFVGQQVLLAAVVAVLERLGVAVPQVQDTFRSVAEDRATAPLLAATAVLLAPLAEELVYRGVLFRGMVARYGFWVAALGSSALFTLLHLGDGGGPVADLIILSGILPLGVVFAAVLWWRGSLLACVVSHGVYNAGGVALLVISSGGPPA